MSLTNQRRVESETDCSPWNESRRLSQVLELARLIFDNGTSSADHTSPMIDRSTPLTRFHARRLQINNLEGSVLSCDPFFSSHRSFLSVSSRDEDVVLEEFGLLATK